MVCQVEWSTEALDDLREIKEYITQHSPANAESVTRQIERAAANLVTFPYGHRVIPELADPDGRETFVHRWRLMYRILPDRIVGVVHGARLLSNIEGRSFEEGPQAEYIAS